MGLVPHSNLAAHPLGWRVDGRRHGRHRRRHGLQQAFLCLFVEAKDGFLELVVHSCRVLFTCERRYDAVLWEQVVRS